MEWQHNIPDDKQDRVYGAAANAVYDVGKAIIERLEYIAEALGRKHSSG